MESDKNRKRKFNWTKWSAISGGILTIASMALAYYLYVSENAQSLFSQQHSGVGDNNLNVRVENRPRTLNSDAKKVLVDRLDKNMTVFLSTTLGDGEAWQYADQIRTFLIEEGYQVQGVDQVVFDTPVFGVDVEIKNGNYIMTVGSKN